MAVYGIPPESMKKTLQDAILFHEGVTNPPKFHDMVTSFDMDISRARVAFIGKPTWPRDVLESGESVFDPSNTILTCPEVQEKLASGDVCLVPTGNGKAVIKVVNRELLRPGPQNYIYKDGRNSGCASHSASGAMPAGQGRTSSNGPGGSEKRN